MSSLVNAVFMTNRIKIANLRKFEFLSEFFLFLQKNGQDLQNSLTPAQKSISLAEFPPH